MDGYGDWHFAYVGEERVRCMLKKYYFYLFVSSRGL